MDSTVATPNYGYEKRQKELAKKRKKEEKLKAKADRKVGGEPGSDDVQGDDARTGQDTHNPGQPAQS